MIPTTQLYDAEKRAAGKRGFQSLQEARGAGQQTAFLSHSGKDAQLAVGLQALLLEKGWNVYLYWQDSVLSGAPTKASVERVQEKIRETDWLIYLATANSRDSRWCPWEIGYADGVNGSDAVIVAGTRDIVGNWHGQEYLQIYRHVAFTVDEDLAIFAPDSTTGRRARYFSKTNL